MKPDLGRRFLVIIRLVGCAFIVVLATIVIADPRPSIRLIGMLCASIGFMIPLLINSSIFLEDMIVLGIGLRQDIKLIEMQNFILHEIKTNNKQVIDLVVSQAELLSRMASAAIKKDSK